MDNRGSISIQVLFLLVALVIIAGGFVFYYTTITGIYQRELKKEQLRGNLIKEVGQVLVLINEDKTPLVNSFHDEYYKYKPQDSTIELSLKDESSKINPNWVRIQFLERSVLASIITEPGFLSEMQQKRFDSGFYMDVKAAYVDYFQEEAFSELLGPFSYLNLNTADEFVIERITLEITGNSVLAANLRNYSVQKLREQKLFSKEEAKNILNGIDEKLLKVITIAPQINVNTAAEEILRAVILYPAYNIPFAQEGLSRILNERDRNDISPQQLQEILGCPADHHVFTYLGTETWFWSLQLKKGDVAYKAVFYKELCSNNETMAVKLLSFKQVNDDTAD